MKSSESAMKSTTNRFQFDSLPMELKEKILEKVDPVDSMKLLKVNKQLRAYILYRGPFYKRFHKIHYCFGYDWAKIGYYYSGEDYSTISLDLEEDDNVKFCMGACEYGDMSRTWIDLKHPSHFLPRSTRAHLQFLGMVLPPKIIEIECYDETFSTLDFLQPTINLRDLIPNCRNLHTIGFNSAVFECSKLFQDLMQFFSPRIMERFECEYNDTCIAIAQRADYLLWLKSMLVDCKEVHIDLVDGGDLLLEALRECNFEKVMILLWERKMDFVMKHFEMIATKGIPSRNSQAVTIYKIYDFDFPHRNEQFDPDDDDYSAIDASRFLEQIRIEVPSVRLLSSHTGNDKEYQRFYEEICLPNRFGAGGYRNLLWIYKPISPNKGIIFVYYNYNYHSLYLVARHA